MQPVHRRQRVGIYRTLHVRARPAGPTAPAWGRALRSDAPAALSTWFLTLPARPAFFATVQEPGPLVRGWCCRPQSGQEVAAGRHGFEAPSALRSGTCVCVNSVNCSVLHPRVTASRLHTSLSTDPRGPPALGRPAWEGAFHTQPPPALILSCCGWWPWHRCPTVAWRQLCQPCPPSLRSPWWQEGDVSPSHAGTGAGSASELVPFMLLGKASTGGRPDATAVGNGDSERASR